MHQWSSTEYSVVALTEYPRGFWVSPAMGGQVAINRMQWGLRDQLRFVAMLLLWAAAWLARSLLVFLPQHLPTDTKSSSVPAHAKDGSAALWAIQGGGLARTAIGRALSQVLELVNDLPATSRKYEFARTLADKMMYDNAQHGSEALKEINRMALEASFTRTSYLLASCLHGLQRQQQVESLGWPWRLIKRLPQGAATLSCHLVPALAALKNKVSCLQQLLMVPQAATALADNHEVTDLAEKLAQELLWLAQRLRENSALEVAILHWSSSTVLAKQALSADRRVQRLLVKLSALFCAGLVSSGVEPPADLTLKLLLLWLPLFCRSTHGIDGQVFSSAEKQEAERVLEKAIQLLPDAEQELVLGLWLGEYVMSPSDWPNLQACYTSWCYSTRKLNFAADETVMDGEDELKKLDDIAAAAAGGDVDDEKAA